MSEGLKSIGGLWIKQGKKSKFMSGEIELLGISQHILVFKNDKDGIEKRPDYRICLAETTEDDKREQWEKSNSPPVDDEVPF